MRIPAVILSLLALAFLAACGSSSPVAGGASAPDAQADYFSLRTSGLQRGQVELLTLSTLPDAVTGEDVLVAVRGLDDGDTAHVFRNGEDVSGAFTAAGQGELHGLVAGLHPGDNQLGVNVDGPGGARSARLDVLDHPITGPVLSGPHQAPFICQTEDAGLGKPLDADCSIDTVYQWYYKSTLDQGFHLLADPYAAYPADTMQTVTADGKAVPFVARVESATINRGIARIAVLDDPAARGPAAPFTAATWNHRVYYAFGESCGTGYHQGVNQPNNVLGGIPAQLSVEDLFLTLIGTTGQLGHGDVVVHSTLSTFGVHCNPLLSMETAMMIKEHIIEQYGLVKELVGTSGSGAALQQYNAANNAPGLMTAMLPIASFPDITSTVMMVADCGQVNHYFTGASGWNPLQQAAVYGELPLPAGTGTCESWVKAFLPLVDPGATCDASIPKEQIYDAKTNPGGARCTIQDANINWYGRDAKTGFARLPYDNTGVQYGLNALNSGVIGVDQFLDLNRGIGGYSADGAYVDGRMRMDADLAQRIYSIGQVIGRGALAQTPNMDIGAYFDLVPGVNIHSAIHPFTVRARLRAHNGGEDQSMSQWRGVLSEPDIYPIMEQWFTALEQAQVPPNDAGARQAAVLTAKPAAAADHCSFGTLGGRLELPDEILLPLGLQLPLLPAAGDPAVVIPLRVDIAEAFDTPTSPVGPCEALLPVTGSPRLAAGEPLSDDVIRCQLKPIDPADYKVAFSAAQMATLRQVFPLGVCDWSKPAAEDVAQSLAWPSVGGTNLEDPHSLVWRVGRSQPGRY